EWAADDLRSNEQDMSLFFLLRRAVALRRTSGGDLGRKFIDIAGSMTKTGGLVLVRPCSKHPWHCRKQPSLKDSLTSITKTSNAGTILDQRFIAQSLFLFSQVRDSGRSVMLTKAH